MGDPSFVFPNDPHVSWSIMIVLYPYITGLVAGAFVVSALYHVFRQEVFKPVARLALVTALCFCAFATLPLLLHLHHPERALNIMVTPNLVKILFSPLSGTTSAIVPSATSGMLERRNSRKRCDTFFASEKFCATAHASLNATPMPESSPKG